MATTIMEPGQGAVTSSQLSFLDQQSVDKEEKPFSFGANPEEISISGLFEHDEINDFISQLQFFDPDGGESADNEGMRARISIFIAEHLGENVRSLFGYTPRNIDGRAIFDLNNNRNISNAGFVFGRIHIPSVGKFSALVEVAEQGNYACQFKIKFPLFNASLKEEVDCRIEQTLDIATPVDLLIPATYRTVRWQNDRGYHFYVTELVNYGQLITTTPVQNEFDNEEGFEKLSRKGGVVNKINPTDYKPSTGPVFRLQARETFLIGFKFPALLGDISGVIKADGEATVQESISIKYMVEPGHEYVMYDAMSESPKRFEHYWSHK